MGLLSSLKKRVAGGLDTHHPVLRGLLDGEIAITDAMVEEKLRERFKGRIKEITFRCEEGRMRLLVAGSKKGTARRVVLWMRVEQLVLSRHKRRAVLHFLEPCEATENADDIGTLVDPEALASMAEEQSQGVVEIQWPRAILHFDRHPELDRMLTQRLGPFPAVVDLFEIRDCRIEDGKIVLPVHRPKKRR